MKIKGFISLLICAIIFGIFGIFIRILSMDLTSYQQVLFRNLIGFFVALTVVIASKQSLKSLNKVSPKFLTLYALSFPLSVVFFTLSILEVKIANTLFSFYTGNLLSSLFIGSVFFKETLNKYKITALILVLIGIYIHTFPLNLETLNIGIIFGLLAGLFDATANSFRKYVSGKADRFVLVSLQMLGGMLVASVLIGLNGQNFLPHISTTSWGVGLVFGTLLVAISYLTLVGFQNFDLNLGTIILSSEIFFAILFAFLFFRETPKATELIGALLVISATGVVNLNLDNIKIFSKNRKSK